MFALNGSKLEAFSFFFFQAEDGIRDIGVTGVQTCALPIYQIQTKFRDEFRPRFGLLRVREFLMKDAYSFHANLESLNNIYDEFYKAYQRIFTRCGIPYVVVEAESGPIGGSASHEFMAACA